MKFKTLLCLLPLFALLGCASRVPNMIARNEGSPVIMTGRKLGFSVRPQPTPFETALEEQLIAELTQRGFQIVPQTESDYTLNATQDRNWHETTMTQHVPGTSSQYVSGYPTSGQTMLMPDPGYDEKVIIKTGTPGIRLRVYETRALKEGRFRTVWEGYVDAGMRLRPEDLPKLVQTLCNYLGQDFVGRVDLKK